jgi:ssDNA-binding replication factor A large subunit
MEKIKSRRKKSYSCRRKMGTQELIQEILQQNRLITKQQIQAKLEAERTRTNGLLCDETLLRLIAAKNGIVVPQNSITNNGVMPINRLLPGLHDVTVNGYLIAVSQPKTFQGPEKSGKFATLTLLDEGGLLRVMLWDERVELVEKGELRTDISVRLLHGYTKQDRNGKTELHMGKRSQIEIESPEKATEYPSIERFASKISALNTASGNVIVLGKVKAVLGKNSFSRPDGVDGIVMKLTLADESGQAMVIVWNEKAEQLKDLKVDAKLQLVNARVKDTQNAGIEIHVDSNTTIKILL